jgi:hypothetical protein
VKKIFFILLQFIYLQVSGQAPSIQWQKCLGGSQIDGFGTLKDGLDKTLDKGFIVASRSNSPDGDVVGLHPGICGGSACSDGWVIKLDSLGFIQWQKCLGGSNVENFSDIHQTLDSGYIAIGVSNSNDGDVIGNHSSNSDIWVCKLNSAGNLQWQKCLGGTSDDFGLSINLTNDGGYILGGLVYSDNGDVTSHPSPGQPYAWVVKLDSFGALIWGKCLPNTFNTSGANVCVIQVNDGGYILASSGFDNQIDYCLSKLDSSGNLLWQKFYGGSAKDEPASVIQTRDGGFIICGYTLSHDGDVTFNHRDSTLSPLWHYELWIVKTDSVGNLQFQKTLGGNWTDTGVTIEEMETGYIAAGTTMSDDGDIISGLHGGGTFGGPADSWIISLDTILNIQWEKCLGGLNEDDAESILLTEDGGLLVKSSSYSNDGDVSGNHGNGDIWIAKLSSFSNKIIPANNDIDDFSSYLSNGHLLIKCYSKLNDHAKVELLDLLGHVLLERRIILTSGMNSEYIDVGSLCTGAYIVRLISQQGLQTKKIVSFR